MDTSTTIITPKYINVAIGVTAILIAVQNVIHSRKARRAFKNVPTLTTVVPPFSILTNILPRIPYITLGRGWGWRITATDISGDGGPGLLLIRSWLTPPLLCVADAVASKTVCSSRTAFPKSQFARNQALKVGFGPNLSGSEHEEWRKHRRIAGPSFSESNNNLVWETSVEIVLGFFQKWTRDRKVSIVTIDNFTDVTIQLAYMVFAAAGFGIHTDWVWDQAVIPPGKKMSFPDALRETSDTLFWKLLFPEWALRFFKKGRRVLAARADMEAYMREMIEERKPFVMNEEKDDLLSNLIRASLIENSIKGEYKFTPQDLLGNIWTFLFAGHETTAASLAFSVAYLSLYQEEQEKLYQHIRSVVPEGRLPICQDMPKLTRVLAFIYEILRLNAPVSMIVKEAAEDFVLPTSDGEQVIVPKGTLIAPMITATHFSESYWSDPQEFRPDRFLGEWNKDAWFPFSAGARVCIGKKFSETEQIAALSIIVLHYKVSVLEEPQFAHETTAERRTRVLATVHRTLPRPKRVPVTFTPRAGTDTLGYYAEESTPYATT